MLPTPTYGPSDFCFAGQKNEFFQINYNASAPAVPAKRTLDPYVTGTSVLAIKYKDGVMMTADTLGSYGSLARFKDLRRIRKLGDNTLIGGSGEYSDYQYLMTVLEELIDTDKAYEDGNKLRPQEIYSYLTRVMYGRRNKFDPLWNQLVVAGVRDGVSFLGYVDLVGTSFEEHTLATGYGAYLARPLLRKAWKEDLTEEEAKKVLDDCMRVLFYRDARTINRIQVAKVTEAGIEISEPYSIETEWGFAENVLGYK